MIVFAFILGGAQLPNLKYLCAFVDGTLRSVNTRVCFLCSESGLRERDSCPCPKSLWLYGHPSGAVSSRPQPSGSRAGSGRSWRRGPEKGASAMPAAVKTGCSPGSTWKGRGAETRGASRLSAPASLHGPDQGGDPCGRPPGRALAWGAMTAPRPAVSAATS